MSMKCPHCQYDISNCALLYGRCPSCGEFVVSEEEMEKIREQRCVISICSSISAKHADIRQLASDLQAIAIRAHYLATGEKVMTVREHARNGFPLSGTDAKALEASLLQVEEELASAKDMVSSLSRVASKFERERDNALAEIEKFQNLKRKYEGDEIVAEEDNASLWEALANCHMSARRGIASPTVAHQQLLHIVRFCEEAGVTLDILRTRDDYGVVHEDSGSRLTATGGDFKELL